MHTKLEAENANLGFRFVWAAMSLEEYFWEGPKIRVPPCSLPPFAGAHVGRAAVVMFYNCPQVICKDQLHQIQKTISQETTTTKKEKSKTLMQKP